MSDPLGDFLGFCKTILQHANPDTADPLAWGRQLPQLAEAAMSAKLGAGVTRGELIQAIQGRLGDPDPGLYPACMSIILHFAGWAGRRRRHLKASPGAVEIKRQVLNRLRKSLNRPAQKANEQPAEAETAPLPIDDAHEVEELGILAVRAERAYTNVSRLGRIISADPDQGVPASDHWITREDAATLLGKDPSTVSRYAQAGKLRSNGKANKQLRIDPVSVTELLLKASAGDKSPVSAAPPEPNPGPAPNVNPHRPTLEEVVAKLDAEKRERNAKEKKPK